VWAVSGEATVSLGATPWRLAEGEALWVPGGTAAVVRGAEQSSVLPIRMRDADRSAGPDAPFTAPIPEMARFALLAAFTRSLGVLHGGGVRASSVLSWIGHTTASISAPALPPSPDLRRVAERMLDDPPISPGRCGADLGLSESTVARRFQAETGWSPARWRARSMLARAAEQIRRSGDVGAGVMGSGYASPSAFARAFRREWGMPPSALVAGAAAARPAHRRSTSLGPQCNGYHIVFWVAGGTAEITVDDATWSLESGDVACLPAGASVALRAAPDAAAIPLGWLPGGIDLPAGIIAHSRADAFAALVRLIGWTYAGLAPTGSHDARVALQAVLGLDEPAPDDEPVARAAYGLLARLTREPRDAATTAEYAAQAGVAPEELRDAVEALTGTTLATWRARTRMSWARRLLREGMTVTQVARRVGYADAAGFSRAFTRAHGDTPSRFRAEHRSATLR
jgi:AraC-like DNA-binding protein/quercetin dioxygenase-like cupin family protein